MKNKPNQITIIYMLIALFVAIVFQKISTKYSYTESYPLYHFFKDITLVLFTGIIYRGILSKNEKQNKAVLEKLLDTNNEIKESNEKYDIVAKATSDTIWDWKIQEDKLFWNKGIKAIFGYNEDQVGDSSKWWFDNIHPEDSIKMSIKLYSFIEQKTENWQDEYRFKCANNSYKYVLDRGFLLKDENGKAIRMIGAIQDITKQKEEELRLKLLETVIVQTKDSIIITEADFNKRKLPKIVYVNPAFSVMTGYEFNETIGKSPDILKGQNSDINGIKKIIEAIKNREESLIEMIAYKKDNEEFWLRFSMIPIYNSDNELSHWVSIQRDVSDEKKQEKEKEQLIRELTKNNKDLKEFSYITSHNLRAPLSNLTGLLSLIEDISIEDAELKEILFGFNKSTHLLNETINDLTKVMIIKDNPSIQKEALSLKEVFENVFSQIAFQFDIHKPVLEIDLEQVSILNINKTYIESILLNLLTNSLKYRAENKILKITITATEINNYVTLSFEDNGIGIDLGLYLVKSQVEAMGGTICVESEVNKGTTFTLIFKNT
jgi:PAS domain S-box-containing protein